MKGASYHWTMAEIVPRYSMIRHSYDCRSLESYAETTLTVQAGGNKLRKIIAFASYLDI